MGNRAQDCRHSAGTRLFWGAIFGFVALSWYFLLPLAYFTHLTPFSLRASSEDRSATETMAPHPDQTPLSQHDGSCPICRMAETSQDFAFLPAITLAGAACLFRLAVPGDFHLEMHPSCRLVSDPRAPPMSL